MTEHSDPFAQFLAGIYAERAARAECSLQPGAANSSIRLADILLPLASGALRSMKDQSR